MQPHTRNACRQLCGPLRVCASAGPDLPVRSGSAQRKNAATASAAGAIELRIVVEVDLALRLEPKLALGRLHSRVEGVGEIGNQRLIRVDDQHRRLDHVRCATRVERQAVGERLHRVAVHVVGHLAARRPVELKCLPKRHCDIAAVGRDGWDGLCLARLAPLTFGSPAAIDCRLIPSAHPRHGLRVVGEHAGHAREGTEATILCDRAHHRSGAEADAQAEQGQVGQPVVGEERGRRVLDVLDVGFGVLELARLARALAEVSVVKCEPGVPALGHGLGVRACRLLFHRGERADCDDDAGRLCASPAGTGCPPKSRLRFGTKNASWSLFSCSYNSSLSLQRRPVGSRARHASRMHLRGRAGERLPPLSRAGCSGSAGRGSSGRSGA